MATRIVRTENPVAEQWRLLSRYFFPGVVTSYVQSRTGTTPSDDVVNHIIGSLQQAKAYFDAAAQSPLHVSPVFAYYGATNLLLGMSSLLSGGIPPVKSHGLRLDYPISPPTKLADFPAVVVDGSSGLLTYVGRVLQSGIQLPIRASFKLSDLLASIPEILDDFVTFPSSPAPLVLPVEVIPDGKTEAHRLLVSHLVRIDPDMDSILARIPELRSAYLPPQMLAGSEYVFLRPKLSKKDILLYSVFGDRFLQVGQPVGQSTLLLSQEILFLISLFIPCSVARYSPQFWHPFVTMDRSGERLLVELVVALSCRVLPNRVLSRLLQQETRFVYSGTSS